MQHGPAMHMGMSKKLEVHKVALKDKRQIAEGSYEFVFEKPDRFRFSAGQHVRMTLIDSRETDAEGNSRFFTMASTPQQSDLVFAMRMRDTAFKRVLSSMQVGEKVLLEKLLGESPHGAFALHDDVSKPAVFIVGGIGIVPAYSMIKDALERKVPHKMFLFYSNRRPEDAPYLAELKDLAEQNPFFTLIATMTQPEKSAQVWQGESGFINRAMLEKYVSDLRSPIYYVAGLPEMVDAMQTMLAEIGVDKENIRAEEFAGFNMAHSEDVPDSKSKNHWLIVFTTLIILAVITVHIGLISHANFAELSLNNPLSYLLILSLLVVVAFKVFAFFKLKNAMHSKQNGGKLSARDILEAHQPTRKK